MGSAIARRLTDHGAQVMTSLTGRAAASAARAQAAGMQPVEDTEMAACDIFLSVVPPGEALALAQRFAPLLASAAYKPVYVDCNAVNPQTMAQVAAVVVASGARVVDAAIFGPPPKPDTPGPMLYGAGAGAAGILATLGTLGLRVRALDGPIGAASALKMSYAGITKGLTALAAAMALGAVRAGAHDALLQELSESQPTLLRHLQKSVPDMFPKAYRWVAEMEEVAGFLGQPAHGSTIYTGAAALYQHLAADGPSGADIQALAEFFRPAAGNSPT